MAIPTTCSCGKEFLVEPDRETAVCPACGKALFVTRPTDPPAEPAAAPKRQSAVPAVLLACLGLILVPVGLYTHASWRAAGLEREVRQLPQRRQQAEAAVRAGERDRHLQLVVTGPAAFQPGAPNAYQIETKSLAGRPVPATLTVRVLNEAQEPVHEEKDVDSPGTHRLTLPRSFQPAGSALTLEVMARAKEANATQSWLRERLALTGPVCTTHLFTDKPLYRPGEVVSFRSLTLDRLTLRPPAEDLRLHYTITSGNGDKVFELAGATRLLGADGQPVTGPDRQPLRGVGAGEYAIPTTAAGGEYTLTVAEVNGRVPPQQRKFLVNRYERPRLHKELEWARRSYGPGEKAAVLCRVARVEGGTPLADQPVTAIVQVDGKHYDGDGNESAAAVLSARTDADGRVQFRFTLPHAVERGEASLSVQFTDGGNVETLVRPVPLVLKKLLVDFYPEGGDLIAGVPNRVYFQARTTLGKPSALKGRVLDPDGKSVVEVQTLDSDEQPGANQGLGRFELTPEKGKVYVLRVESPRGIESHIALPTVREEGVVLSVPAGAVRGQEPVRALLSAAGRERRLVVGVYARGALVDHREVTVKPGPAVPVLLDVAKDLGGVYRVTVFEAPEPGAESRDLRPVAERLVYRAPPRHLQLAVRPDKSRYVPGDKVRLDCAATGEDGKPAPAVLLLAVVDQGVLNLADEKTARALPTHFLLTSEVRRPEDLEHADFLLGDHPLATEALDLLLGTQGWRRFAEQDSEQFLKQQKEDASRLLALSGQAPVQTSNVRAVEQAYQAALQQKLREAGAGLALQERLLWSELGEAQQKARTLKEIGVTALVVLLGSAVVLLFGLLLSLILRDVLVSEEVAEYGRPGTKIRRLRNVMLEVIVAGFLLVAVCLVAITQVGSKACTVFSNVANTIGATGGGGVAAVQDRAPIWKDRAAPMPAPAAARPARPFPKEKVQVEAKNVPRADPDLFGDATKPAAQGPPPVTAEGAARPVRDEGRVNLTPPAPPPITSARRRFDEVLRAQRESARPVMQQPVGRRFLPADGEVVEPVPGPNLVVREYAHQREAAGTGVRTDFTETLYWHPVLVLPDGQAAVAFDLCDSVTRFQVTAFGHTLDGRLGAATAVLESRLPFSIEPKLPIEVTANDRIDVPVTIANDTDLRRSVRLRLQRSGLDLLQGDEDERLTLDANQRARRVFRLRPALLDGQALLRLDGLSEPFAPDSIQRSLAVVPDGFPVAGSRSDLLKQAADLEVVLPKTWYPGTLQCQVQFYPSPLADVLAGLDGLLREPHGCFEQTSSTSYPNLLILDYLRARNLTDVALEGRAGQFLDDGYRRLVTFECQNPQRSRREGYDWFGGTVPPHEALTAYGLMQFRDLARVYDGVDRDMVERTRQFLLSRKDGKGGFQLNRRGLDTFGRAPERITNAYIVWALTEGGPDDDLTAELAALAEQAKASPDPYFLALVARGLLNRAQAEVAKPLLEQLVAAQKPDGGLDGAATSITHSAGRNLQIETTALAVLAWLKAEPPGRVQVYREPLRKALRWLGQQRNSYGGYGATQATILALKAFLEADSASKAVQAGEVALHAGDRPVSFRRFPANTTEILTLALDAPEKLLKPGKNRLRLELAGDNELPYTLTWSYRTDQPPSAEACPVKLQARLDRVAAAEGETVRLLATVQNTRPTEQGMTVAILGLPAGLTLPEDFRQLRDLARPRADGATPGLIDAWETRGRELILYWRGLAAGQKVEVALDLVCRVPGEYRGPASRAYLYYDADQKHWVEPLAVAIRPRAE